MNMIDYVRLWKVYVWSDQNTFQCMFGWDIKIIGVGLLGKVYARWDIKILTQWYMLYTLNGNILCKVAHYCNQTEGT